MGFYIRKSVSVGPFRFNFSKSGIGVSTGVKGLRVGTGPRGNYISVGRGGLYYRATLPSGSAQLSPSITPGQSQSLPQPIPNSISGVGPMVELESGPISAMQDSSSTDLLNELNGKAKRPNYWKWTASFGLIGISTISAGAPPWLMPVSLASLAILTLYFALRDNVAKTTVLCYQLEHENEHAFERLHESFEQLASCRKTWRIDAQAEVHDQKYHAGASAVVKRKDAQFGKGLPPNVKANLEVPFVKAGKTTLYFMPDRVLVFASSGVGAVSYKDLQVDSMSRQFIESGPVPGDATVVGRTWKYVNKSGGPDKRFKDNRELPIALYEEITFRSQSGLNELFQISKNSLGSILTQGVKDMAASLPN